MKKLMFAAAAAFCGTVFALESANVVGYNNTAIAGGKLSCISLQFAEVGGDADYANLGKLTSSGLTAGEYDTMNTDAPCIMIYDGAGGYEYYYYISDAFDADENEVTAWADPYGNAINVKELVGTGFWLKVPEATCTTGTLTQSGEVSDAATSTINIAAGLTLAGNPYPSALNMSKVTTSGLEAGEYDTMNTDAPCIMIYDGAGGYEYYYYISDAFDADENEVTAWADPYGNAVTGEIAEAGEAFWARSATAGTLTFSL